MFLPVTISRNPQLIEWAVHWHRTGKIRPNTYVLDLDAIEYNTRCLAKAARYHGIQLYMMTKQIGRNPEAAQAIAKNGIHKAVAVDPWEALHLAKAGIELGNVGHLVQIPSSMVEEVVSCRPEVITVYSVEKAAEISRAAQKQGRVQEILLKVTGEGDVVYEGQWGGFRETELLAELRGIESLPGVSLAGVTAFPCLLYDGQKAVPTPNAQTLLRCARKLEQKQKHPLKQINAPSVTAYTTLPLLKKMGATHGEPGHALTGTTPLHRHPGQKEIPAMVYISEISHIDEKIAYAYSGGHYRRSRVQEALVGKTFDRMKTRPARTLDLAPDAIDYYTGLQPDGPVEVGDTVVYAFRTQIFVTRSEVAVISGLQTGRPQIRGLYDSSGKQIR
ncbi:alanine racemase [Paludifilum halophilum]|uniref:Uncharacterized protein n=1 Tax=Paludifilum halophilum TaxID=1642702 RepID=A0A235B3F2_9BACL|nr:alanine racemase [Paludifilum halophilum]OYD06814.1 hypothetical protein CHM34_14780 [Paludifilum halophilum]